MAQLPSKKLGIVNSAAHIMTIVFPRTFANTGTLIFDLFNRLK